MGPPIKAAGGRGGASGALRWRLLVRAAQRPRVRALAAPSLAQQPAPPTALMAPSPSMRSPAPAPPRQAISVRAFKVFGGAAPAAFELRGGAAGAKRGAPGLTCILGPNGCGKSALLEALCFALGAPATTMRVKLLRELVSTESGAQVGAGGARRDAATQHPPGCCSGPPEQRGGAMRADCCLHGPAARCRAPMRPHARPAAGRSGRA